MQRHFTSVCLEIGISLSAGLMDKKNPQINNPKLSSHYCKVKMKEIEASTKRIMHCLLSLY